MTALAVVILAVVIARGVLQDREPSRYASVGEMAAARATTAARLRRFEEERALFIRYDQAWARAGVRGPRQIYLTAHDGRRASGG